MPIYEYQCVDCGTVTDIKHGFKEAMNDACAKCGGALKRLFHAAGIVFKGSGFYVTDSRKSSAPASDKGSGEKSATAPAAEKTGEAGASAAPGATSSNEGSASGKPSPEKPAPGKSDAAGKGSGGKSDAAA